MGGTFMRKRERQAQTSAAPEIFIVVRPITYGEPEIRHEAGAEVSDIPVESIPWLLEQGHITRREAKS